MIEDFKNKKIRVSLSSNEQIIVKYGTRVKDILALIDKENEGVLAAKVNNSIKNLDYELCENSKVSFVKKDDREGYRIYTRTVKFLLYMALERLYPSLDIEVCNLLGESIYFICKDKEFTNDMAVELLKEMRTIVKNDSKFERKVVSYEEARFLFEQSKNMDAIDNLSIRMSPYVTIYISENIYGMADGVLAPRAGLVDNFNIKKFRKGFLLIVPKNEKEVKIIDSPLYSVFEEKTKFNDIINIRSVTELNKKVIDGKIEEVIRVSEAEHDRNFAELIADIEKKGKKKVVLIAGPSSSGKTTFTKKLCINLKLIGYNPVMISMDNYFKEREDTPLQENGEYDFETIEAVDMKLFSSDMKKLFNGKKVQIPDFNFIVGKKEYKGNFLKLEENDILVLEGIHTLNPQVFNDIDDSLKYKIYIAPMTTLNIDDFSKVSTTDTRILRRILRDFNTRGNNVEKTLGMWSNLMRGESKWIYPYTKNADYIFNSSYVYEIGALRTFVEPLLLKVNSNSEYFSEARRLYNFIQKFLPIETTEIPEDSIIREFIGNSSFKR